MQAIKKSGMSILRRGQGQRGFTLVELLVVTVILGVLAAVVVPTVARFAGSGKTEAQNTELANVQSGVDALMAENKLVAVTGSTAGAAGLTDFSNTSGQLGFNLYPNYMRQATATIGKGYCFSTTGLTTAVTAPTTC